MFNLLNAFILLSEAAAILTTISEDPIIAQMGPYNVVNAGTNTMNMRKI